MFSFPSPYRPKYFPRTYSRILRHLKIPFIGPTRTSPSRIGISHISKLRDLSTPASGSPSPTYYSTAWESQQSFTPSKRRVLDDHGLSHLPSNQGSTKTRCRLLLTRLRPRCEKGGYFRLPTIARLLSLGWGSSSRSSGGISFKDSGTRRRRG